MKVCCVPNCPTLTTTSRCTTHGGGTTTAQRGYGYQHQLARAVVQARIDNGEPITCWNCGTPLHGTTWHLDHTQDRDRYRGPACIPCNTNVTR